MNSSDIHAQRKLEILQHSLGVDRYGRGEMYRNHFCAGEADEAICRELVAMGYMQQHRTTELFPYFNCSVTEAGKRVVLECSPKPPKLTRSQRRYREFLNADCGVSFREWLGWKTAAARRAREIARCDREIQEIASRPGPDLAYLTVMGLEDWEYEKRTLQAMVAGGGQ